MTGAPKLQKVTAGRHCSRRRTNLDKNVNKLTVYVESLRSTFLVMEYDLGWVIKAKETSTSKGLVSCSGNNGNVL